MLVLIVILLLLVLGWYLYSKYKKSEPNLPEVTSDVDILEDPTNEIIEEEIRIITRGIDVLSSYSYLDEANNPNVIKEFWSEMGRPHYDHTTNWCGLAVAIGEIESGYLTVDELPQGFESARAWLKGYPKDKYKKVEKEDLQEGDIVVKWRVSPDSWQGHVSYFKGWAPDNKYLSFGGNQSNKVRVSTYEADHILAGIRRV